MKPTTNYLSNSIDSTTDFRKRFAYDSKLYLHSVEGALARRNKNFFLSGKKQESYTQAKAYKVKSILVRPNMKAIGGEVKNCDVTDGVYLQSDKCIDKCYYKYVQKHNEVMSICPELTLPDISHDTYSRQNANANVGGIYSGGSVNAAPSAIPH